MKFQTELYKQMVKKILMKDYTSLGKAKLFNKMSFKFHKMTLSTFSKEI
jgi:hypothetical protein